MSRGADQHCRSSAASNDQAQGGRRARLQPVVTDGGIMDQAVGPQLDEPRSDSTERDSAPVILWGQPAAGDRRAISMEPDRFEWRRGSLGFGGRCKDRDQEYPRDVLDPPNQSHSRPFAFIRGYSPAG